MHTDDIVIDSDTMRWVSLQIFFTRRYVGDAKMKRKGWLVKMVECNDLDRLMLLPIGPEIKKVITFFIRCVMLFGPPIRYLKTKVDERDLIIKSKMDRPEGSIFPWRS